MSYIQNLFTSRDNNADGSTYVGQEGRLWWNPDTNALYYSDGTTPGGIAITSGGGGNGVPGGPANSIQFNSSGSFSGTANLKVLGNGISVIGNVTSAYFIGDGSQLTNLPIQPGNYSNANVANYLPTYSGNITVDIVSATGNISGGYAFFSDIRLNDLSANAILYTDADRNVFNTDFSYNPDTQTISGEVISLTGNITADYIIGDGSQLTNLPIQPNTYGNANVEAYLPTSNTIIDINSNVANLTTSLANTNSNVANNSSNIITLQGQVYTNSNVASYLPTYSGNITGNVILATGNITGNYFIGNGSQLTDVVQALVKPNNLLYVAKNGNDTTGTGSINAPYLTIQAAIDSAVDATATTIMLAPGNYVGNLIISNVANSLNITGSGLAESAINGNITISGTSNNIEFDNLRIETGRITHSASGYWSVINSRFAANTGITKTSTSTIKIFNTDLGQAGTGNLLLQSGKTNIYSSQIFNPQVSGANTEVNFLQCDTVILPVVTSGNVNFIDTNIVSAGSGNSLTALGGYVTLKNCLSITPSRGLAPIGFSSGATYSYGDSAFDLANSTFAGTAVVQSSQFQQINVKGGNISATGLISVTGNATAGNILTVGLISATGNITGNYFIGNGSQLTGITANYSNANVAAYLPTYSGNITAGNVSVTGNIIGRLGNGNSSISIASNGNITLGIGTFGTTRLSVIPLGISVSGNIYASSNVSTANLSVTGISNLNSNANIIITGGNVGDALTTNGTGNLSWANPAGHPTVYTGANTNVNIDFTNNSLALVYLPTANINITLSNYTAGHQARVVVRYGDTSYAINQGIGNAQQSTEGVTTIPVLNSNSSAQLVYTCFDNTADNCYVAATFL